MNLVAQLSFLAAAAYLVVGGRVLWLDRRARANQLFALCCLCFAVWSGGLAFFVTADTKNEAWFWYRATAVGWTWPAAIVLHLLLTLTGAGARSPRTPWLVRSAYALAGLLWVGAIVGWSPAEDLVRSEHWWSESLNAGPLLWLYATFPLACAVGGLWVVRRWGRRHRGRVEGRQASVVFACGVVALVIATVTNLVLPLLEVRAVPPLAGISLLVWALGFYWATARYRLMAVTHAVAAQDVLDTVPDALLVVTPENRVDAANDAARALFGADEDPLVGRALEDLLPGETLTAYQSTRDRHEGGAPGRFESEIASEPRGRVPISVSASEVVDRDGYRIGTVLLLRDISDQKKAEAQLQHLATHDTLTRLPNRLLLHDRLLQAIAGSRREGHSVGVLLLDLDRFKQINDTLGHSQGDQLLKKVANRLIGVVREEDTVARMGGDEFVVVGRVLPERDGAAVLAERILRVMDTPFELAGRELKVAASIGICTFPEDGGNVGLLLRNADLAMYAAKGSGRGTFKFFEPAMREAVQRDMTVEAEIRDALAREEFRLYYQPICRVPDGEVMGMESLIRWDHPTRGILAPRDFLPIAESTGLIVPMGRWVIAESCRQYARWRSAGFTDTWVSVNLSPRELRDPDLVSVIDEALAAVDMPARMLQIEITEKGAMQSPAEIARVLTELSRRGVRIALDDFGAGYSSFFRLRILPIQTVKIDRMFISSLEKSADDRTLVAAIIAMARSLGLGVVAEGVETTGQLEVLARSRKSGQGVGRCDLVQGFLISRPLPAESTLRFLQSRWQPQRPTSYQTPTRSIRGNTRPGGRVS